MKRKLTIAAGIIHRPRILFLDEPTTGIDMASTRQIRKLIADLNGAGTTIFITTHYIEEAERLCGRIAFWNILLKEMRAYYHLYAQDPGQNRHRFVYFHRAFFGIMRVLHVGTVQI
jgi:ABC-type Mn2+/Zn2+ transport system ATPase subunit